MLLLCIAGIPSRGLKTGQTYTQVGAFHCRCRKPRGKFPLVAVYGAIGRTTFTCCPRCKAPAPQHPQGWFAAYRFVPMDPQKLGITKDQVEKLYRGEPVKQKETILNRK